MPLSPLPLLATAGGALPPDPSAMPLRPSPPVAAAKTPDDLLERQQARDLLARLRESLARMDAAAQRLVPKGSNAPGNGRYNRDAGAYWTLGLAAVDSHLPAGGLLPHALHDIAAQAYGDMPAAMGFALALALRWHEARRRKKPVLWCRTRQEQHEHGRLYGHGLAALGLQRRDFLTVTLRNTTGLLWLMEEALKSGCFSAVLGDLEPQKATLTVTRRLALAAAEGRCAALAILARDGPVATASASRWRVSALPSMPDGLDPRAPGLPLWSVALTRIRGGRPGHWTLQWGPSISATLHRHPTQHPAQHHAPHHFTLVSGFSGRALPPRLSEETQAGPATGPALRAG